MMRRLITATTAALALAGVALTAAAPADAQRYGRGGYGRGYGGGYHRGGSGAAIGAGILGLAVGAAIASDRPRYYGGGGGYYGGGGGYYGGPAYYAPPPPPPGYYEGGYGACRSDWRWDGYRGRYVRVRYCD